MSDSQNNLENLSERIDKDKDFLETLGSEDGTKAFGEVKEVLEAALIVDEYINVK